MALLLNQEKLGSDAESINALAERLSKINWYQQAGKEEQRAEELFQTLMHNLNVHEYELKWISKEEAGTLISTLSFEGSALWEVLKLLPDSLKQKVDEQGKGNVLEKAVDVLPEFVFHHAFEKAFQIFQQEKVVQFLTTQAMYLSILIATAEIAGESDLFLPLLELLESGHVPLGPEGNVIYLL